ncbi:uncharacterized protein LOC132564648 [Ylistrum balloti]|uniref:uncharacterized protein LOC132564648 n=1 Tax=Ylistrum balloti TaxID=509963 RepID=UPI0029057E35|nr:uncharacterized protein LOC132564648 [Ylistrum balloti]
MEMLCLDYLSLEPSKGGIGNILVITDHFTRYAQAIPTRNQTAKTTAEAIFNNFIVHYGIPQKVHTDQGTNFESDMMKELCSILGMERSRTTPYHPMGNGTTERFNRTWLNMLRTLEESEKCDWARHISSLVHAYNCTRHDSTGLSPFQLMFGREPRLPVDIAYGVDRNNDSTTSLSDYVDNLKTRLEESYKLASSFAYKAKDRQKAQYDKKKRGATIQVNDRVLVKILAFDGKHKLSDIWEEEVYKVHYLNNQRFQGIGPYRRNAKRRLLPDSAPEEVETQDENNDDDDDDYFACHYKDIKDIDSRISGGPVPTDETQEVIPPQNPDDDHGVAEAVDVVRPSGDDQLSGEDGSLGGGGRKDVQADRGLRRSTRQRATPAWKRSGDYVFRQQASSSQQDTTLSSRMALLETLAQQSVLSRVSPDVAQVLVNSILGLV